MKPAALRFRLIDNGPGKKRLMFWDDEEWLDFTCALKAVLFTNQSSYNIRWMDHKRSKKSLEPLVTEFDEEGNVILETQTG